MQYPGEQTRLIAAQQSPPTVGKLALRCESTIHVKRYQVTVESVQYVDEAFIVVVVSCEVTGYPAASGKVKSSRLSSWAALGRQGQAQARFYSSDFSRACLLSGKISGSAA